jgi:hypothetical protein
MAKLRCPVCGATHKGDPATCRLCGASMFDEATLPGSVGVRTAPPKKKGLSGLFLLAIVGVLLIAALAIFFGFGGSDELVDRARTEVPALQGGSDGWQTVDDGDGAFTVELPGEAEKGFVPFGPADDGRAEQWVAVVGDETELTVAYTGVAVSDELRAEESLAELASDWAITLGGTLDDVEEEVSFKGYPGLIVTIDDLSYNDESATARALLVLRGETLYIAQSLSIYKDHPQFNRMANSLTFTS